MEKLTDQKVLLLEDEVMERCGQHPMWMYLKTFHTDHAEMPYESFLLQKREALRASDKERSGIQERKPQSAGGLVLFPHHDVPAGKTVDLKSIHIGISSKAYLTRMWRRLGRDPLSYYTQVKKLAAEEWKERETFLEWLDQESRLSVGRKLLRFDQTKPYGPDNCMLGGPLAVVSGALIKMYDIDFVKIYRKITVSGKEYGIAEEWNTLHKFLKWVQHNGGVIPAGSKLYRLNASNPFSPQNCRFSPDPLAARNEAMGEELREKINTIQKRIGQTIEAKYRYHVSRGTLCRQEWSFPEFCRWVVERYEKGQLESGMYLNRVHTGQTFRPDNAYFSFSTKERKLHGMSRTKLYYKYIYFSSYYKDHLKDRISFLEFMEHAIKNRDYQLNKSLFVQFPHEQITLEQVGFLDMNSYCDINRICRIYQEIPRGQNDFGNLDDFMEWTIRSGYHAQSEFRKVIDENSYSAKTCVWDRFTRKDCGGTIENK